MRMAAFILIGGLLWAETPLPPKPVVASELDREKLKRIQLQVELLQKRLNEEFQPLQQERNAILEKLCGAAGFDLNECQIDTTTGAVTKIEREKK